MTWEKVLGVRVYVLRRKTDGLYRWILNSLHERIALIDVLRRKTQYLYRIQKSFH